MQRGRSRPIAPPRGRRPRRFRDAAAFGAAVLLLAVGWWLSRPRVGAKAGMSAPALSLEVVANGAGRVQMAPPKEGIEVMVLEFFASWCRECRHALPSLERRAVNEGAHWIAVSVDASAGDAALAARNWALSEPVAHDARGVAARAYGIEVVPTTVILGTDGKVTATYAGTITGDRLARALAGARRYEPLQSGRPPGGSQSERTATAPPTTLDRRPEVP